MLKISLFVIFFNDFNVMTFMKEIFSRFSFMIF